MPEPKDISNISVTTILGGIGVLVSAIVLFVFTTWIGHVESSLAAGEKDHNSHSTRLTTLEANYGHIIGGLNRIEESTKHTAEKVDKIEDNQAELREKVRRIPSLRQ